MDENGDTGGVDQWPPWEMWKDASFVEGLMLRTMVASFAYRTMNSKLPKSMSAS